MKINKKFSDTVTIEWLDAQTYAGWKNQDELITSNEDYVCVTRGFFVQEDDLFITLAHTIGKYNPAEGDVCGVIKIPKGMIIRIK